MTGSELMQRLEKLERDNRRLKALALSTLALAAALGGIYAAQPAPRTVRAGEFALVDGTGTARIKMGVHEGMPEILLSDAQGTPHLGLYINKASWPIVWLTGAVVPYGRTLHLPLGTTGESARTSAASITMFANGKKRQVIWRAL